MTAMTSEDALLRVIAAAGVAADVCSAGLVVGVGRRDEDFVRGGITHLLEHVIMHEVGRVAGVDSNAHVTSSALEFTATGRPDRVAGFLRQVCSLLADPPVAWLPVEARVLRAEDGDCGPGPLVCLMGERYSAVDVGLAALPEPALLSITPDHLRAWASRHAVRGNAALWVVGELPEGALQEIGEALPPGETPLRGAVPEARPALPAWTPQPFDGAVSFTFETGTDAAAAVATEIFRRRVEDELRHRRGLVYGVSIDSERIDDQRRHAGLVLSLPSEWASDAVTLVVETIGRLAGTGPTRSEIEHAVEDYEAYLADPRSREDELSGAAEATVRGWSVLGASTVRAELPALELSQLRRAAGHLRDTLLVGVPDDVDLQLEGVTRLPQHSGRSADGTTYTRRLLGSAPRGARIIVGDDGVTLQLRGDGPRTVLWPEVVGLVREAADPDAPDEEVYHLLGVDGTEIPLVAGDWRRGGAMIAHVLDRVPDDLTITADPDPAPPA